MRSARGSVRVRITALATLLVAVAVSLAGFLLVRTVEDALERHTVAESVRQLRVATDQLQSGATPSQVHPAAGSFTIVQILDDRGRVVSVGPGVPGLLPGVPDATVPGPDGVRVWTRSSAGGPDVGGAVGGGPAEGTAADGPRNAGFVVRSSTVSVNGDHLTIVAASSLADVRRSVAALERYLSVGLPLLVALVGLLAWFVVGRALRPVEAMRAEVEAITSSTIHRRVDEPARRDELGRLARTMNAMLDRLEQGARRQREFVSDASHELRSPMAVIRTKVEVAQRKGAAADWPAVADAVLAEEARLEALVADLLELARDDEARARPSEAVELVGVVRDEAARQRRRPVRVVGPGAGVEVRGDGRALRSLVAHLLDNAARHARRKVQVSVEVVDGRAVLTVDDDGAGIPLDQREHVFERFTRLDESRVRDRGGAGLGLAVVRAVARAHGGEATAEEGPLGGARLVVVLPLA